MLIFHGHIIEELECPHNKNEKKKDGEDIHTKV